MSQLNYPFLEFSQYRKSIEFSNELDRFLNRLLNRHPGSALLFSSALHSAPTLQDAFNYSKSVAAEAERIALPGGSEGQIDLLRGNSVRHAKRATCLSSELVYYGKRPGTYPVRP